MRKILIALSSLMACAFVASAQQKTIEPSGNIITKDISVKSFDAIRANGLYELILTQGDKESVKIEADDNVQDLFNVSNDGSTLVIDMPKLKHDDVNIKNKHDDHHGMKWKVYVSFKNLKSIDVGVVGNVHSENAVKAQAFEINSKNVGNVDLEINTSKLTVQNNGVGNLRLNGTATDAVINNSGVGALDGEGLVVQTMNINNSGVGHASVNVQKDLTIKQSFLGKVSNKGNAKKHEMEGVEM